MFSVTTFAENNIENLFSVLYAVDLYMISQLTTSDAPDLEKKYFKWTSQCVLGFYLHLQKIFCTTKVTV